MTSLGKIINVRKETNFIRLAKHKSIHLDIINVISSLVEPIAYYFFFYSIHECKLLAWWLPDSSHHHHCQSSGALNKLPFDDYLRLLPISLKILRLAEKCLIENQVASNFSWSLFAAQSTKLGTEHTVVSTNCRLFSQFSKRIDDITPFLSCSLRSRVFFGRVQSGQNSDEDGICYFICFEWWFFTIGTFYLTTKR